MSTGKLVTFDPIKGYGFIAPDSGGKDIFVHVEELGTKDVSTGARLKFQSINGSRGPKAYDVAILENSVDSRSPASLPPVTTLAGTELENVYVGARAPRALGDQVADSVARGVVDDDDGWDVLTAEEYSREITDVLIGTMPEITAAQIVEIRQRLVTKAEERGWLED
jgi:cold shock protein